jgi:hypothetical protein
MVMNQSARVPARRAFQMATIFSASVKQGVRRWRRSI